MVQDRKNNHESHGFSNGVMDKMPGKTKNGMVRKSTARSFDSVRSTNSFIYNSSGGEETGEF